MNLEALLTVSLGNAQKVSAMPWNQNLAPFTFVPLSDKALRSDKILQSSSFPSSDFWIADVWTAIVDKGRGLDLYGDRNVFSFNLLK